MRVTIFGGSFDPPHIAHIAVINEILESIAPDVLIILVSYANLEKLAPRFSAQRRLSWMQNLCKDKSTQRTKVIVSDIDIKNRITNTINSIYILKRIYKNASFDLVMGSDYADSLPMWDGYNRLKEEANFIMVERIGHPKVAKFKVKQILKIDIDEEILSTNIRLQLRARDYNLACVPREIKESLREENERLKMIDEIIELLDEKKAQNPCHINIESNDYIARDVILATSLTGKHASALLNETKKLLKEHGGEIFAVDDENDEWIVIDAGDLIIHIMTQSVRNYFKLEEFLEKLKSSNLENKEL